MFLTAITVISFGMNCPSAEHRSVTSDVYKIGVVQSANLTRETNTKPSLPTSFVNDKSTLTKWGVSFQTQVQKKPIDNPIHKAFDQVGVPRVVGDNLLALAKNILSTHNYSEVNVVPFVVNDPEENTSYLTLRLHINADFEKALELDSLLTEALVDKVDILPEKLSFAVY